MTFSKKRIYQQIIFFSLLSLAVFGFGQACSQMASQKTGLSQESTSGLDDSDDPNDDIPDDDDDTDEPIEPDEPDDEPDDPPPPSGSYGYLFSVSIMGEVFATAEDPKNPQNRVTLQFYVDGPRGQGINAGTATPPEGYTGVDYFIPEKFRDQKSHKLYAYAKIGSSYVALENSPVNFTSFLGSAKGKAYYENTLQPILQKTCGGCHGFNYDVHFPLLIDPFPSQGGTATNNLLINKASATVKHGGGKRCTGGKTSSPCTEISQWWNLEFK